MRGVKLRKLVLWGAIPLFTLTCFSGLLLAGETIEIPIESVAGLGKRRLRALEPDLIIYRDTQEKIRRYSTPEGVAEMKRLASKSLVIPIEQAVQKLPREKKVKSQSGFAVNGHNREALPEVYHVFVKGEKPHSEFTAGTDVSLVFFSPPISPAVILDKIVQKGDVFEIHYMLKHRKLSDLRYKLVLIPCGTLSTGTYKVEIIRNVDREKEIRDQDLPLVKAGFEDTIICRPFTFRISDRTNQRLR